MDSDEESVIIGYAAEVPKSFLNKKNIETIDDFLNYIEWRKEALKI